MASGLGQETHQSRDRRRIDELRLYRRALAPAEIARRAAGEQLPGGGRSGLGLDCSFDEARAADASGHDNHGSIEKATSVEGKFGRALLFYNPGTGSSPSQALVNHRWSIELPLMARGMVLAGDVLFIAGPPDLVDEEQAARTVAAPDTQAALAEQAAALDGKRGGLLWAVSATHGGRLHEHMLDAPPVFDGLAAAGGCLFLVTADGRVICFGPPRS